MGIFIWQLRCCLLAPPCGGLRGVCPPSPLLSTLFSPVALCLVYRSPPDSPQVRKYKSMILEDLESALLEHAPAPQEVNSELPPLTIDGIPVSVDKMTQVSLQKDRGSLQKRKKERKKRQRAALETSRAS